MDIDDILNYEDLDIEYCKTCIQMTNHLNGFCQKHSKIKGE
jgi:hypothetical protein